MPFGHQVRQMLIDESDDMGLNIGVFGLGNVLYDMGNTGNARSLHNRLHMGVLHRQSWFGI